MKNCRNIKNDLSALIDGELSAARQAEVIAHVDNCPDCARHVAELRRLATGISALPKQEPPPQFLAGVRHKLRPAEPPASRWAEALFRPVWLKVPLEALAVVVLVVGGFWLARPEQPAPVVARAAAPAVPHRAVTARILPAETAPAPAAQPADVKLAGADFRTKSFTAESGGGAPGGKLVDALRVEPLVPVIIRGESLVAVRLRATDLAKALNGQVAVATPSNTFVVHLPQRNVGAFRTAMSRLRKAGPSYALTATAAPTALSSVATNKPVDKKTEAEPVVELEVIVEPAGK